MVCSLNWADRNPGTGNTLNPDSFFFLMLKWGKVLSLCCTYLCLQSCKRKATSQSLYRVTDEMWFLHLSHRNTAKKYLPRTFAKFKGTCLWFRGKCNHACWLCGNTTLRVSCDSFILNFFYFIIFLPSILEEAKLL